MARRHVSHGPGGRAHRQHGRGLGEDRDHRGRRRPARRRAGGHAVVLVGGPPHDRRRAELAAAHGARHGRLEHRHGVLGLLPDLHRHTASLPLGRRRRVPHPAGVRGARAAVDGRAALALRHRTQPPRGGPLRARRPGGRRLALHRHVGDDARRRGRGLGPDRRRLRGGRRLPGDRSGHGRDGRPAGRDAPGPRRAAHAAVAGRLRPGGHLPVRQLLRLRGQHGPRVTAAPHQRGLHRRPVAHRRRRDHHLGAAPGGGPGAREPRGRAGPPAGAVRARRAHRDRRRGCRTSWVPRSTCWRRRSCGSSSPW